MPKDKILIKSAKIATKQKVRSKISFANSEKVKNMVISLREMVSGIKVKSAGFASRQNKINASDVFSTVLTDKQHAMKRLIQAEAILFNDLPGETQQRALLSHKISLVSRILRDGHDRVTRYALEKDAAYILSLKDITPVGLGNELKVLRRELYLSSEDLRPVGV